ncbi:MAG: glycosyltransferase family 4 protein [Acidimicrobiales bacterium]
MFAGALSRLKGLDVLLEAWAGLEPRVPLVLAGLRRPDSPRVFPPGVWVAESVPRGEVLQAWAHCLVAVVPSVFPDPHPTVAIEAMAAGRPVVASAVGGLTSIVTDEETGYLVKPGSVDDLRRALQRLIANPTLCSKMGDAAAVAARRFDKDVVVPQLEQVYQEAIANNGGRSDDPATSAGTY